MLSARQDVDDVSVDAKRYRHARRHAHAPKPRHISCYEAMPAGCEKKPQAFVGITPSHCCVCDISCAICRVSA
jgi:hypothetical protein